MKHSFHLFSRAAALVFICVALVSAQTDTSQLVFSPSGTVTKPAALSSNSFGPVFDLDSGKLAVWQANGWGSVHLFDVSNPLIPTFASSISAPDQSYDNPSFGGKISMANGVLFIANPYTWISGPHDGRVYAYNLINYQSPAFLQKFAVSPHGAGYFGVDLSRDGDVLLAAQGGNSQWDTHSAIFVYKVNTDKSISLIGQQTRSDFLYPYGSAVSGDYCAITFNAPADSAPGECWVHRIERQGGAPNSLNGFVAIPLGASAVAPGLSPWYGGVSYRTALSGRLLAVAGFGPDAAAASDNSVVLYRIDDNGATISASNIAAITPSASGTSQFGRRIKFLGKRLLVSDPLAARQGTTAKGVVHIYRIELDGTVISEGTLSSKTNGANELFGEFLEVDPAPSGDGLLAVGVKLDGSSGTSNYDIQLFNGTLTVPEIEVQKPVGTVLVDGNETTILGTINVGGASAATTYTVRSIGTAALAGLAIAKGGANPNDFTVSGPVDATVAPGAATTFTVSLTPTSGTSGPRSAVIQLASNDSDENPFDIAVTGQAFSTTDDADGDGMNDWGEYQLAALGFDWQVTQTAMVNTYFAGANANGLFTKAQLQALNVNHPLIQQDPMTGQFTLTIGVEKSTDLGSFNPFPMTAPQTLINAQGKLEFRFTVPDNAAFFQLRAQ